MGLSSSKTTTGPSKAALPHLNTATSAIQGAYDNSKGVVSDVSGALKSAFDKYDVSSPALDAANSYTTDVLGGKYLDAGNPYLQGVIDKTNNSVRDQVNALFSNAGQTGSSRQIGELGSRLSESENSLRYTDYSNERDRMAAAVSSALGLNSANNENLQTWAGLGSTAAGLPMEAALGYANGIGSLWGNSTTTKQSASLGQALLQAGSAAAGAYAASDPALKQNIEYVGPGPGGLSLYAFDYIDPPNDEIAAYMAAGRQIGVMADEVEAIRQDALGPMIGGYRTVNYGAL